jgi:hypothetical protein
MMEKRGSSVLNYADVTEIDEDGREIAVCARGFWGSSERGNGEVTEQLSKYDDGQIQIPVIGPQYQPSLRYRFGCMAIRAVAKLTGVEVDFEPLALPGDRVTGYVDCPHCKESCLVTVSLCNETKCLCRYCYRQFTTMNDCFMIWILMPENR